MYYKNISIVCCLWTLGLFAPCSNEQLATLEKSPTLSQESLATISQCLDSIESNLAITHSSLDSGPSPCADNTTQDQMVRLANFEIRTAIIENNAATGTFCCIAEECAANCPTTSTLTSPTCDPDCQPHAPGLLTTLEAEPRIKNLCNRLRAVAPLATPGGAPKPSCPTTAVKGPLTITGLDT
jgi:hypothetical protein